MADRKLSELTTATPVAADLVYLVDVSDTTDGPAGSSRKCTASALVSLAAGTTDHAALSNLGFSASGHTDFAGLAVANAFTVGGHTIATAKSVIGLTITGASGQAADLFECKNSAGTTVFEVSALGVATANSFSGSGSGLTSIPQSGVTDLTTDLAAKQPLDGDLTAIAALTGTDTIYYRSATSTWTAVTIGSGLSFSSGTLSASGGGGGAPDSAKYVTLATDGTLSQERVLTGTTNQITITDNGAGSTVVLSTPQDLHTGASPQFTGVSLGNADTTLTRTGAGDIAVEGKGVYRDGGTDVPVADGGTGASTAAGARTNLDVPGLGDNNTFSGSQLFTGAVDIDPGPLTVSGGISGGDITALVGFAGDGSAITNLDASQLVAGIIPDARMPNLTGDVTTSEGAVATTIANNAVTDGKLRDSAALSVIGRGANSSGDPADIAAGTDGFVLRRSGTTLAFGTLAAGAFADGTIAPARVVFAADNRLLARSAGSAGNGQEVALSGSMRWRSNQPAGGGTMTTESDGATVTFDINTSNRQRVTLGGNRTLALSNDADGDQFTIVLTQDGGGSRTVTWWAGIKWPGGTVPTLTTTGGKHDVFSFLRLASGEYLGWPSLNH